MLSHALEVIQYITKLPSYHKGRAPPAGTQVVYPLLWLVAIFQGDGNNKFRL